MDYELPNPVKIPRGSLVPESEESKEGIVPYLHYRTGGFNKIVGQDEDIVPTEIYILLNQCGIEGEVLVSAGNPEGRFVPPKAVRVLRSEEDEGYILKFHHEELTSEEEARVLRALGLDQERPD